MFFAFIVLLSGFLRLMYITAIEFKVDEAVNLFLSSRILFGHPFPPGATVSSFGILNPPLFLYVIFPFVLISTNPMFVSAGIAIINAFAVGFYYLTIKKYYTKSIAVFSSLLLATGPWAIIFSRKIWAQDVVVPLTVGLIFFIHKIVVDKNPKYWTGVITFTLFLLQIHQATIFFLVPLFIFLVIKTRPNYVKYFAIGFVLGVIPMIPYIVFEIQHKFLDVFFVLNASHRISSTHDPAVFIRPLQIINQGNFHYLFGDDVQYFAQQFTFAYKLKPVFYIEYVLVAIGAILFAKNFPKTRIFLYATMVLLLSLFIFQIPADMHYFIILLPLLFLFLGISFRYFWGQMIAIKIASLVLFSVIIGISILFIVSFLSFANTKGHLNGDYGTIFGVNQVISKNTLKGYEHLPDYNEILLAKYVPLDFMHGNNTVAIMLYNNSQTKKDLQRLDKRLEQVPVDYRIYHQLLSFYTTSLPTRKTLEELRSKASKIPLYSQIYTESYNDFLNANLVKEYDSPVFGLSFEYPRHYSISSENMAEIDMNGDGYIFVFKDLETPCIALQNCTENFAMQNATFKIDSVIALSQTIHQVVCTDSNNNWCGSLYGPFIVKKKSVIFLIKPGLSKMIPSKNLLQNMLNSLRGI